MKYDIKSLTLDEKLRLLTGRNGWQLSNANEKLPDVFLSDGPHGLRMYDLSGPSLREKHATAMPNLSALANTWDTELAFLDGATIADECLQEGADVLLAPGVNIKRTPLCGRNFEYFSEDPYLAGVLAKAYIEGVQSKGVGTSLKHFCANNTEYDRFYQSSDIDERTLREIYLTPFEIAVQAQPWTVMCAYNAINGIRASENKWLFQDILRDEFGFDGLIVSDWGAVHNSWRSAKAGIDLEMPFNQNSFDELKKGYENGWLTEEEIDARVEKILQLMEKCTTLKKEITTSQEERHQNAVKIAKDAIVLLKNEDNLLPLQKGNIGVGGTHAFSPCFAGGGSALVVTDFKSKTLVEDLTARLGENANVYQIHGIVSASDNHIRNARNTYVQAYESDVVVLCMGNDPSVEYETTDRAHMRLTNAQEDFIINTAKVNPNVVVVLNVGSAVDMSAWVDKVKAVVLLGFAGEGAQEALADVLTGKVSPCGKLSETYPLSLDDTPTHGFRGNGFYESYNEGVFVGYRWYDKTETEVLFPFGHGLSYAQFVYSDMQVNKITETDYEVSFTVKNVSNVDAKEISQVYVRDVFAMVPRPEKELKGFVKTELKAGESKRVSVKLNARSFAYYSIPLKKWYVENGYFEILVGASSKDIRLTEKINIQLPENEQWSWEWRNARR